MSATRRAPTEGDRLFHGLIVDERNGVLCVYCGVPLPSGAGQDRIAGYDCVALRVVFACAPDCSAPVTDRGCGAACSPGCAHYEDCPLCLRMPEGRR